MHKFTVLLSATLLLLGCGGESASDATGGSGGASGGGGGVGGSSGTGGSGAATGGSAGTGGLGGGSGGAGPASPECASDDDCKRFADCCSCLGMPVSEDPVPCPALCVQDKCAQLGAPAKASCVAGRCVAGFSCDPAGVFCNSLPPSCKAGEVPLVDAAGTCWEGSCVPAGECKTVKACADCTGDLVCASWQTQVGIQNHCVDVPSVCSGDFSCGCLGPSVCTPPYATCADFSGQRGVSCSCPNC